MRTSLVLLALACGLAVCAAQLMNAAVTSTTTGVNTATTATVTFTSTKGQAASATSSVNLPCFSQACVCDPSSGLPVVATPQIIYSSPSASCPATGAPASSVAGVGSSFTVSNTNGPALTTAATVSTFTVTASTTSNLLTVDGAGSGSAPTPLGGNKVAVTAMTSPATGSADLVSGAATANTLVFNFKTTLDVASGGSVIVNLPYNYLATQSLTTTVTGFTGCAVTNTAANPTNCASNSLVPVTASGKITCASSGITAGSIVLTFTAGWKSGDPTITNVASGYTVQTMTAGGSIIEGPADTGATLTAFTNGVLAVAPTFTFSVTPGDLNAQVSATTGTLTLGFKPVSKVTIGNAFVLTTPLNYFRTLGFTSSTGTTLVDGTTTQSGTASCTKPAATSTTTNDVWTCITSVAQMNAGAAVTWIAAATAGGATTWNVLNNQAAGTFSIMTATAPSANNPAFVIDSMVSSAAGGAPAIVGAPGTMAVASMALSAATDSNPGLAKSTGTLTISGIVPPVELVAARSVLVFTFPYKYITASAAPYTTTGGTTTVTGVCDTSDTAPGVACSPATPTAGYTTMVCTIVAANIPTGATATNLILTANGANNYWRIASNTASGTFTVQAMSVGTPRGVVSAVSSGVAVTPAGSTVTAVAAATNSVTTVPGDKLPGITTTGTLTLGVTPASPLSIGSTIVFTLPANYLMTGNGVMAGATISTSSGTVTCTLAQASGASTCVAAGTTSTISCVTGGAVIPSGAVASVTFALGTWSLARGATGTYTATTYNFGLMVDKMSPSAALITATAPGIVSSVQAAVFSAATDQVPGLATTTGTLKFTFTTATTIPSGYIAIQIQSQYLNTVGAFTSTMANPSVTGPSGSCSILSSSAAVCATSASVQTCGESQAAQGALQILACSFATSLTAGVVTLSLTAGTYTVGSSQPASKYAVSTGNNAGAIEIDATSTTFGSLPALAAGVVSAVSTAAFSVAGDMVPGTTSTGTLTFGFTTATDLISGALIQVALPVGYLSSVILSNKLGTAAINCALSGSNPQTQGCGSTATNFDLMTCTTSAGVTKGAQSLVLQPGFVVGAKNAAAGTGYRVQTATATGVIIDTAGSGSVPAITAGASASGSGTAAASVAVTDLVPGTTTTGTLTLAFTTATSLPMTNGKIIVRLTPGWLRTATAATLAVGSTASTSTCSALSLTSGSAATSCTAAVPDTLTCTLGGANLAAGNYNLVLTIAAWSVGAAQSAGTFSVYTTNNNVVLDAASTTTGILPQIGGTVQVTTFAATTAADAAKIGVASSGTFTIGFTTATKLAASSTIVFTLPAANYFSGLGAGAQTISGGSTTAPTCTLTGGNTKLQCVINAGGLNTGASVITLAIGWTPGATVISTQFPTLNSKATYTISNLMSPPKYLAAATYSAAPTNYNARFGVNECSAALAFPQFGTAPPTPGGNTPGASSGKALVLSAVLALSSIMLFLF